MPATMLHVTHHTVFAEPRTFAGWPANHGAWQRGDHFLVGFMLGPFTERRSGHRISEPFQKVQARSHDGGETWRLELPNVDFESSTHIALKAPPWNLRDHLIRACGIYDHGGEHCDNAGGFYLSSDFGATWQGAFPFAGITPDISHWCTARTAYLANRDMVFLSYAVAGFDDYTICATVEPDGRFSQRSIVCADENRAVMPAVAEIGNRICVALRRRMIRSCWIDVFVSDDNGQSFKFASEVSETGGHNGNPPALAAVGSNLYCAYANRTDRALFMRRSSDGGVTWDAPVTLRQSGWADIGYPRLFVRQDGRLCCVYYWSDHGEPQHIESTIVDIE